MLDENSLVLLALSTCVLVEEYQHVAGLDLGLSHGVFPLLNIAVFFVVFVIVVVAAVLVLLVVFAVVLVVVVIVVSSQRHWLMRTASRSARCTYLRLEFAAGV